MHWVERKSVKPVKRRFTAFFRVARPAPCSPARRAPLSRAALPRKVSVLLSAERKAQPRTLSARRSNSLPQDYHGYGAVDEYAVEEHFGALRIQRTFLKLRPTPPPADSIPLLNQ
jgi:hypothetical protein